MIRGILAFLLAFLALSSPALADDNRPLTVTIEEQGVDRGAYRLTWKVPANIEVRHIPELSARNGACTASGAQRNWSDIMGHWREETWNCGEGIDGGIMGIPVDISYPNANPNLATIIRFRPSALRGEDLPETQTILLQPQDGTFTLAKTGEARGSFVDFLILGIEHIGVGFDHLLFVAGLIFIARTPRRVFATITGFTIAHSVTLALSALGWVRLPIAAIEAVIALSIVFLAVEIVKGRGAEGRDTLTWRRPIIVASVFGLLHGFGFAAVLAEIGLPQEGFVAALLAFNLGIEIGQIIFAALVLMLLAALGWAGQKLPQNFAGQIPLSKFAGYGVGILASFWMFERFL